jgi:hypothetical protein
MRTIFIFILTLMGVMPFCIVCPQEAQSETLVFNQVSHDKHVSKSIIPSLQTKFKYAYELHKDIFHSYVNNVMTTLGLIIIAIGWIFTSEQARLFLTENRIAFYISVFLIASIMLLHLFVSWQYHKASEINKELLVNLDYLGIEYYTDYTIKTSQFIWNCSMNTGFFLGLIFMFLSIRHKPRASS